MIVTGPPWGFGVLGGGKVRNTREEDSSFQFSGGPCGARQIRLIVWASQGPATTKGPGDGREAEREATEGRLQD